MADGVRLGEREGCGGWREVGRKGGLWWMEGNWERGTMGERSVEEKERCDGCREVGREGGWGTGTFFTGGLGQKEG